MYVKESTVSLNMRRMKYFFLMIFIYSNCYCTSNITTNLTSHKIKMINLRTNSQHSG